MTVGGLSVKYDRWGEGRERERERGVFSVYGQ